MILWKPAVLSFVCCITYVELIHLTEELATTDIPNCRHMATPVYKKHTLGILVVQPTENILTHKWGSCRFFVFVKGRAQTSGHRPYSRRFVLHVWRYDGGRFLKPKRRWTKGSKVRYLANVHSGLTEMGTGQLQHDVAWSQGHPGIHFKCYIYCTTLHSTILDNLAKRQTVKERRWCVWGVGWVCLDVCLIVCVLCVTTKSIFSLCAYDRTQRKYTSAPNDPGQQ